MGGRISMVNNDTTFKSIELLRCWCMKSLPTVFSDALSYNQQVCLLTKAINDMATTINGLPDYIVELVKELLDKLGLEEIVKEVLADLYFLNVKNPPNNMTAAVGDGVADDTVAIQNMITYLGGKRAYLFFPAGIYSVNQLTITNNISLIGLDRYQTTINLKAGSDTDLFTGDIGHCTISNITLSANMPGQTTNCSIYNGNVTDALFDNVIFKNAYNVMSLNINGLVQMNNIVIDGTQGNGLIIAGERCHINNLDFIHTSLLNNEVLLTISGNNCICKNISCYTAIKTGLSVSGNNCYITGTILNPITPIINSGYNNYVNIKTQNGTTKITNTIERTVSGNITDNVTGDIKENITGNTEKTITGNMTESITGNMTESIDGALTQTIENEVNISASDTTITSNDIFLNSSNPLKYGKLIDGKYGKVLPMKDKTDIPYSLLTEINFDYLKITTPQDFGAVGDGVTDDSDAIQNAINALPNGGIVFFPTGRYRVTKTLTIKVSNITLLGASRDGAEIYTDTTFGDTILAKADTGILKQVRVINFLFNHNISTGNVGNNVIHMYHVEDGAVNNVRMENGLRQVYLEACADISFLYCAFIGRATTGGTTNTYASVEMAYNDDVVNAVKLCTSIAIVACRFLSPDIVGAENGLLMNGVEDIRVTNSYFGGQLYHAIHINVTQYHNLEININNCYIDACGSDSVRVDNSSPGSIFMGNFKLTNCNIKGHGSGQGHRGVYIADSVQGGTYEYYLQGLTISGCSVTGFDTDGVYILCAENAVIEGNSIFDNGFVGDNNMGLVIGTHVKNAVISNNLIGAFSETGGLNKQQFGIALLPGCKYITISNNNLLNNVQGAISYTPTDVGTNSITFFNNQGFNGGQMARAWGMAGSGVDIRNPFGLNAFVRIFGGTVSDIKLNGTTIFSKTDVGFEVQAQDTINITYTEAPESVWFLQ